MSWSQTILGPVYTHPSGWRYFGGQWYQPPSLAPQAIITHPIVGSSQVSMQFGVGQVSDIYSSLSASQQAAFNQALFSWVTRNGARCQVADTSSIHSPNDLTDPANRQLALECFRGMNSIQSSTSGLDQATYSAVLNTGGVTPTSAGGDTTPSWMIPVGIGLLALVAGIGVAYVVTKPPKTHQELVHEIYGKNPRLGSGAARRRRLKARRPRPKAYIRVFQGPKSYKQGYQTIGSGSWSYSIRVGNRTYSYYGYSTRAAALAGGRDHAKQKGWTAVVK
jgi:hypothetical protein